MVNNTLILVCIDVIARRVWGVGVDVWGEGGRDAWSAVRPWPPLRPAWLTHGCITVLVRHTQAFRLTSPGVALTAMQSLCQVSFSDIFPWRNHSLSLFFSQVHLFSNISSEKSFFFSVFYLLKVTGKLFYSLGRCGHHYFHPPLLELPTGRESPAPPLSPPTPAPSSTKLDPQEDEGGGEGREE